MWLQGGQDPSSAVILQVRERRISKESNALENVWSQPIRTQSDSFKVTTASWFLGTPTLGVASMFQVIYRYYKKRGPCQQQGGESIIPDIKLQEIPNARVGGVSCGMVWNLLAKCCLIFYRNILSAWGDDPDVGGTHLPSYLRKYQFSALFPLQVRRECVWTWAACVCQQGAEVIEQRSWESGETWAVTTDHRLLMANRNLIPSF